MNKTYSKSILLYLTPAVWQQASRTAHKLGVSLNAYIRSLIDADIERRKSEATEAQK